MSNRTVTTDRIRRDMMRFRAGLLELVIDDGGVALRSVPTVDEARRDFATIVPSLTLFELLAVRHVLQSGWLDGRWSESCVFGVVARMRGTTYEQLGLGQDPRRPFEAWLSHYVTVYNQTPVGLAARNVLNHWLSDAIRARASDDEQALTALVFPALIPALNAPARLQKVLRTYSRKYFAYVRKPQGRAFFS